MKITDPYFLQAASNRKNGFEGLILRFSEADPGMFGFVFMYPQDLNVTATKDGVTTTTEYQGVQYVDVQADADTDIIVKGDFTGNQLVAPYIAGSAAETCTKLHVNCAGLTFLQAYALNTDDVQIINTESLTQFCIYSNVMQSFDLTPFAHVLIVGLVLPAVEEIDLSPLAAVTDFEATLSSLKSLDISMLSTLETLGLAESKIETLDLSHNTALTSLHLETLADLQSIHLAPALTSIEINDMPSLSALDISGCAALVSFDLQDCLLIGRIDTSHNPLLEEAQLKGFVNLTAVDFSANSALRIVDLTDSLAAITALDFTPNPLLSSLKIVGATALETLDLSGNNSLSSFWSSALPSIQEIKCRATSYNMASGMRNAINEAATPENQTIYLNSSDEYYLTIKQAAEGKNWTIRNL